MPIATLAPTVSQQAVLDSFARVNVVVHGRRWGGTSLALFAAERSDRPVEWIASSVRVAVEAASKLSGATGKGFIRKLSSGTWINFHSSPDALDVAFVRERFLVIDSIDSFSAWQWYRIENLLGQAAGAIVTGTPRPMGIPDLDQFFWFYLQAGKWPGCQIFRYPTWDNPVVAPEDLRRIKEEVSPIYWKTQFAARFASE